MISIGSIFDVSASIGERVRRLRPDVSGG